MGEKCGKIHNKLVPIQNIFIHKFKRIAPKTKQHSIERDSDAKELEKNPKFKRMKQINEV